MADPLARGRRRNRVRSAPDLAIEVQGLGRSFGQVHALSDVDLEVPRATVMGMLGHNGAGKTTLVNILATLVQPTAGRALVAGYDVVREGHDVRRRIGITGQFASLDNDMTGTQNLILVARLLGADKRAARRRSKELLELFNLTAAGERPVGQYSGGMRRRLDIAASLVGQPEIIFLDEPTTGLDPVSRSETWAIIRSLTDQGTTIMMTTQDLEEAEALANRITVLAGGRTVATGTPKELKAKVGKRAIIVSLRSSEQTLPVMQALSADGFTPKIDAHRNAVTVAAGEPEDLMRAVHVLGAARVEYAGIALAEPTLHDVYLKLAVRDPVAPSAGRPAPAGAPAGGGRRGLIRGRS